MEVTIPVTQEHISAGSPLRLGYCPVALAIKPLLNDNVRVAVTWATVGFFTQEPYFRYDNTPLDTDTAVSIKHYDNTGQMVPFWFTLDIPEWALKS